MYGRVWYGSNKCIIIFFWEKRPLPYQRGGDFIDGHWINFYKKNLFGNVS
jgi:hypothetical protein